MISENTQNKHLPQNAVNHSVLSLEDLTPYLPYNLYFLMSDNKTKLPMYGLNRDVIFVWDGYSNSIHYKGAKPILRPISDLEKKITINSKTFIPIEKINNDAILFQSIRTAIKTNNINYKYLKMLLEWHFDVFELINKGLAVSIHDVV